MAIEVPQNEEIYGGGKSGGRTEVGSAIRWGGANRGGIHIKKTEQRGVVERDVDLYIIRVGIKRREQVESSEKDRPCLMKVTMVPLACMASGERMPDREWVRSERRAENPGIRKEQNELRLDSWMQMWLTGWGERKWSSSVLLA